MKATSRNTGVHGASNIAAAIGVPMVVRIASKSRIAWELPGASPAIVCSRILGARSASTRSLARIRRRFRTMSSPDRETSASASASVTNSNVVLPAVGTTRS